MISCCNLSEKKNEIENLYSVYSFLSFLLSVFAISILFSVAFGQVFTLLCE